MRPAATSAGDKWLLTLRAGLWARSAIGRQRSPLVPSTILAKVAGRARPLTTYDASTAMLSSSGAPAAAMPRSRTSYAHVSALGTVCLPGTAAYYYYYITINILILTY